jgi:hypothetical protein
MYHLAWAGIAATLLVGAAGLVPVLPWLALAVGLIGLACFTAWATLSGWRIRNPLWRLAKAKQSTRAEQQQQAATRKVKDELTHLFHARAHPAARKLREIVSSLTEELKRRPEPFATSGLLAEAYALPNWERTEGRLRRALEGPLWDEMQKPENEALRRFMYEMDIEKQTAHDLGLEFFFYYSDYRFLLFIARRLAPILEINPDHDERFVGWRKLDEELTSRLRDVLAFPELASFRDDFEKWITKT